MEPSGEPVPGFVAGTESQARRKKFAALILYFS
jgi:hypothetical protein